MYVLELTLEEVFTGTRKIIQHRKRVLGADGVRLRSQNCALVLPPPSCLEPPQLCSSYSSNGSVSAISRLAR